MSDKQYDIDLNQASILVFKQLKQRYSYKKQLKRIYKFYCHNPPEGAKQLISDLKLKIQEVNEIVCGVAQTDISFEKVVC